MSFLEKGSKILGSCCFRVWYCRGPYEGGYGTRLVYAKECNGHKKFLILAAYYRKFIQYFSKIAAPLTQLTKKNQAFVWDDKCETAFKSLKEKLTCTPVLVIPKGNEEMTVYIDACGTGLGAVLMQGGRVVAYASRQLKPHEKRYPTMNWNWQRSCSH